jgi:phasin family protein
MSQKPRSARTSSTPKAAAPAEEPSSANVEAEEPISPTEAAGAPVAVEMEAISEAVDLPVEAAPVEGAPIEGVIEIATVIVAPSAAEPAVSKSPIEPTQPTLIQGMTKMMKTTEDFVAFGQANVEAFVKSGQIWAAGVQELTKLMATCAKESFDESVSTFKAISTAKSVKEAMDLQSSFARAAFEKAMAESNKLTDASIKLTEQTLAPITARVTSAVETFGKAA